MNRFLQIALAVPAVTFVFVGLAWWAVPDFAGEQLGMDLLAGAGLSTQIADLASFFLTLGVCMLVGVATSRRVWFYPPILLLGFAMAGRFIAWLFHGADLTAEMIVVEGIVIVLLFVASRSIARA